MTEVPDVADPWAWAREADSGEASPDRRQALVAAVIVTHNGARWLPGLLDSLKAQTLQVSSIVVVDAGSRDHAAVGTQDTDEVRLLASEPGTSFGASAGLGVAECGSAEWLWFLHDDAAADPDALERLLAAAADTGADIVGPLLVEPRLRRGVRASRVSEAGQTITEDGVITGVVAEGILDQGQLVGGPVLGVNTCGLLVRRPVWDALGGFDPDLPSTVQGLEFCWRARAAGHVTVTQPRARLVHVEASTRGIRDGVDTDPEQDRRRWGLALHEAFRADPLGAAERGRLGAASTRRVAALVVGKDFLDARLERRAVRHWRTDRAAVERLHGRYLAAAGSADLAQVAGAVAPLRLTRRAARSRVVDEWFGRIVDWFASFGARGGGIGLDALTGGDFARDDQTKRRISSAFVFFWVLVVAALLAGRRLFSVAPLSGPQLLPVPATFGRFFARYADPVLGVDPSAGAPWTGLLWAFSLLTAGHPDWVVSLLLLAGVPAIFLVARRLLLRLVETPAVAGLGASAYALIPVLTGAVASGQVGTVVWALLLPVLARLLLVWWDDGDASWSLCGGIGLTATLMAAVEPLTWLGIAAAIVVLVRLDPGSWRRGLSAGLAPAILLISPFTAELVAWPGRLLTGLEPVLAPAASPTPVELLLGRVGPSLPALWVSVGAWSVLWLLALVGAVIRAKSAAWALTAALVCGAVAVVLTRLVIPVPPVGLPARPQASAWIVAMAAGLIVAACLGLDGLREDIASTALGVRHGVFYVAALASAAAVLSSLGWWVWDADRGLERREGSTIPAFIRKDAARGASRTLALDLHDGTARWGLIEDDLPRLGDGERGLAFGGSRTAQDLAAAVVGRIVAGSADERIVPDLRRLGVGYLWVSGASLEQRADISNVPGLGTGANDEGGSSWAVPDAGRLVLVSGDRRSRLEPDAGVPAGSEGRLLLLAEPPDPGLAATLDGRVLDRVADVDGLPAFALPAAGGGRLTVTHDAWSPVWVALQGFGFLVLLLVAAPGSQASRSARAGVPRRASHLEGGRS